MTAEQDRAANPGVSAWVGASAGTGKTHMLTNRVLRLLLADARPQGILCLTFTRAAAAEMANRVNANLAEWATAPEDKLYKALDELEGVPPNAVRIANCVSFHNSNGHPGDPSYYDGGGFDLDGGTTNSVIEYSLSFENSGPGFLVCQYAGHTRPTANNTVRYSVSYHDGLFSANGAGGLQWYSPDATLTATAVYGVTVFTNATSMRPAAIAFTSTPQSGEYIGANAVVTEDGAPLLSVPAGAAAGLNITGNAWWASSATAAWQYAGGTYASLSAFRAGTGQERDWRGEPTGTDADPQLQRGTGFFATCVPQWSGGAYPDIPNSAALDAVRGFSGC